MFPTHSTPGHDGKFLTWSDIADAIRALLEAADDLFRRDRKAYLPIPASAPVDWVAYLAAEKAKEEAEADGTATWGHVADIVRALGYRPVELGRG